MKIKILLVLGLLFFIAGCQGTEITSFEECVEAGNEVMESHPRQCTANGEVFIEEIEFSENKLEVCEQAGGNPLPEFNECEGINESLCTDLGGEYDGCASACRNDPDFPDVICTMQCVFVCSFD